MTDGPTTEVELLWLEALQQVAARASHEIKGALNGACVNLEVVRSRALSQADSPASGLARFAQAAASQLDALVTMNEALLSLARRPRDVADVAATARHLVTLLAPVARSDGSSLTVAGQPSGAAATTAPASAVRLVVAAALLRALDRRTSTTCRIDAADGMVLRLECDDGGTIELDPRVADAATRAGIRVEGRPGVLSLVFPRAGRPSGRRSAPTRETA